MAFPKVGLVAQIPDGSALEALLTLVTEIHLSVPNVNTALSLHVTSSLHPQSQNGTHQ